MNPLELKTLYEGQLAADLEPPVAGHVKEAATRRLLRASRRLPAGELRTGDHPETWVWSDLELDDPESVRVFGGTEPWDRYVFVRWLQHVGPRDLVIVLGNVSVTGLSRPNTKRLRGMPGRKILVVGPDEADRDGVVETEGFDEVWSVLYADGDPPLLMTHVPLWRVPEGCVNVHGHLHPRLMPAVDRHIAIAYQSVLCRPQALSRLRRIAADLVKEGRPGGAATGL